MRNDVLRGHRPDHRYPNDRGGQPHPGDTRLRQQFGRGRWRKLKGVARVRLADGTVRQAELHWYEASGVGRRRMKIKQFLD